MNALYILDDSPWFEWIRLRSTDSTNHFLRHYRPVSPKDMVLATADYQTAGRGQAGNSWEAEEGKNLLFSLLLHPRWVDASRQFVLSQAMALAVCETLTGYTGGGISIKWPNDIYWNDMKICGMLIENTLSGRQIDDCIIGVGLNVNQQEFRSDAPNPASLCQATGQTHETVFILAEIIKRFKDRLRQIQDGDTAGVAQAYAARLYRREGFHPYEDAQGRFEAEIREVEPTGHLVLAGRDGATRRYAFKEVRFLIPAGGQASEPLGL